MAIKLEKVVQTFYENLEAGKITGKKCTKCGNVEFPPVYACNKCGCWDLEWVEISGKAKLHSIVLPAALSSKPEYKAMGKFAYGEVELEEGTRLNAVVRGINRKKRNELLEKGLPVNIHAAIWQREAGYKTVVFELDEE
ncbi:MAG: hypothetical protein IJU67_01755 [Lachnospiraceae bacterium]|nr:hypothetical protein [Lachnospiraceae bacterium]MBQ1398894.1 hypothetical protein [Lachnospiraceae bacterium]MBQ1414929.1 hypothetical protein [Lachnospiraceae bacterium]MBQ1516316.1 hypothetical protein [Lachnospiraceae bacterium]MBQ3400461.1 hypothetical protein [Lachnospiraceae bacterium]